MRERRCPRAVWTVAVVILESARAAWGQAPPQTPVEIYVAGRPAAVSRLESALGAADRPIRWIALDQIDLNQVTQRPRDVGPEARVWVDCSSPDRVQLYFANWNTERFLLREVPLSGGLNPLTLEMLAQMIESSLSALIADDKTGMTRAEMSQALGQAPSAPLESPHRVATLDASLGAFYAAQVFAGSWPIEHGPGIRATLGQSQGRLRLGAWVTGQYQVPETIDEPLAGMRLDTFALRVGAELGRPMSEDLVLSIRIGAGGDASHVAPRQGSASNATLAPERVYWDSMVQMGFALTGALASRLVVSAAVLVDVDLVLRHYDIEMDGVTIPVATPWRVRPGLMVGLAWH